MNRMAGYLAQYCGFILTPVSHCGPSPRVLALFIPKYTEILARPLVSPSQLQAHRLPTVESNEMMEVFEKTPDIATFVGLNAGQVTCVSSSRPRYSFMGSVPRRRRGVAAI